MTTDHPHKSANQVTRARRLVDALDSLGGDIRTTRTLAKSMTDAQWADVAENLVTFTNRDNEVVVGMTPPSPTTRAMAIRMLEDRVKADDNFQRLTHGNQPHGGRQVGQGNGPAFDPVFAGFPGVK